MSLFPRSPRGGPTSHWTNTMEADEPIQEFRMGPCCLCQKGFDSEPYGNLNPISNHIGERGIKPYRKDGASDRREDFRSTRHDEDRDETEWLSHRQRSPVSTKNSVKGSTFELCPTLPSSGVCVSTCTGLCKDFAKGSTVELCPALPSSGVCVSTCTGLCKSACDASVNTEYPTYHEAVSTDRLQLVDEGSDVEANILKICAGCKRCKCSKPRKTSI